MSTSAVASSSTLWATPSKEWVIPSKPKPGRKPKKDTTVVVPVEEDEVVNDKGRRVQNRAAQRAFRERKQSQLAELQARVQSYEQGEIERNVALQNISKRLKEENDALRLENASLKERLARTESERDAALKGSPSNRKRQRAESPPPVSASGPATRKRTRMSSSAQPSANTPSDAATSPAVSTPESHDTPGTPFSAIEPEVPDTATIHTPFAAAPDYVQSIPAFDGCGFCSDMSSCVCREIAMQTVADPMLLTQLKSDSLPDTSTTAAPSVLDKLPPYQPAVPLRRKPTGTSQTRTIFPVTPAKSRPAECSGDPKNCSACANDAFGKAFCEAISHSSSFSGPCEDCPGDCDRMKNHAVLQSFQPPTSYFVANDGEMMSTEKAWQQLKSHPNVSFADLTLLADVVARRSKCTGPRVVISPAPGSCTPERSTTPMDDEGMSSPPPPPVKEEIREPPLQLVPEEILLRCGQQQRLREVQASGVRDALRLLDAKFS